MVRSYLRHEPTLAYGLICSPAGRSLLSSDGKTAIVPALEDVLVWDVKTGEQMGMWHETGHSSPVSAIARNPTPEGDNLYAVGYADGSIRIWDSETASVKLTLNGHKGAVTGLHFDRDGLTLASGSQDTNLILWDIVAESGLFRLKGHRDAITDLHFIYASEAEEAAPSTSTSPNNQSSSARKYLASVSKDGLLKLWDLTLQHCVETILPGKGEIWSLSVLQNFRFSATESKVGALLLIGNSEGKVKFYEVSKEALGTGIQSEEGTVTKFLVDKGQLDLVGTRRVTQIAFDCHNGQPGQFLAVSGSDRSVEVFRMRSEEDIRKKMARRRRRAKEKASKKQGEKGEVVEEGADQEGEVTWNDRIEPYTIVRPNNGKVKSFSFAVGEDREVSTRAANVPLLLALGNNSLEVHNVPAPKKSKADKSESHEATLSCAFDIAGHRSEARALALSSNDALLATADSAGSLKIWNTSTGRVLRTLSCGYALSLAWLPDDNHVLVGCKDGTLRTYNIPSGAQLETIEAHTGPIWSVVVHPGGTSCLSASGDKDVKFWDFEAREAKDDLDEGAEQETDQPRSRLTTLGLVHTRTLKMTDDVLCARYSPDGRLLALSLLDSTVKVFYSDSLKFFLSLYGHKLPVLSLDISGDNRLCVTVSADKNAKIWGLDFGDCHRSLFAHEESVVGVAFEKGDQGGGLMGGKEGKSHHFWTCAKDGKLKYWDGDRFQCIQTMSGHHGDVSSLAVGCKGTLLVSAGADRSIRVWERTEEPLFLEEERERELEEMYQNGNAAERDDDQRRIGSLAEGVQGEEGAEEANEVEGVHKSTKETLMAGERLMEALEIADGDRGAMEDYERSKKTSGLDLAPPPRHPLLLNAFAAGEEVDAHAYVLQVAMKILPAQLDDALLVLPFDFVISLMKQLDYWASKEWNITLVSRILFFLLRNHHSQIVANQVMRTTLVSLRGHLRAALRRQKMTIGYNVAGLNHVKSRLVEKKTSELYDREGFDVDEARVKQVLEKGQRQKRKVVI